MVKGRQTGKVRCFVRKSSGAESCLEVVAACVGAGTTTTKEIVLNTDEWGGYARVESKIGGTRTAQSGMGAMRKGAESGRATTTTETASAKCIATVARALWRAA